MPKPPLTENGKFLKEVKEELLDFMEQLDAPMRGTDIFEHFRRKWYDDRKTKQYRPHSYYPEPMPLWGIVRSEAIRIMFLTLRADGVIWEKKYTYMLGKNVKDDTGWYKGGRWD